MVFDNRLTYEKCGVGGWSYIRGSGIIPFWSLLRFFDKAFT